MSKYQNKYRIESTRLPEYDYFQIGYYYITICTENKTNYFGKIENDIMFLNEIGEIANKYWLEIPEHYPNVKLDEYIIMPNHIHGIIFIKNNVSENNSGASVETQNIVSLQNQNKFQHIIPGSIGSIIRGFKIGVTKWVRQNTKIDTIWQRNYYDHIIRNEKSLYKIRHYIKYNPLNWKHDDLFNF